MGQNKTVKHLRTKYFYQGIRYGIFTNMKSFIKKYLVLISGAAFALIFWLLDIRIDVFLFKKGTFEKNLTSPEPVEIYFRTALGSLFVIFGIVNHRILE